MKTLIVDDEPLARAELERLLQAHPEVDLVGTAPDATMARDAIARHDPDLLLLDIQMPEENGFELLASLEGRLPRVIFTTAHESCALRAFEFGAVDYLLKPVKEERLREALQRARASTGQPEPDSAPESIAPPPSGLGPLKPGDRAYLRQGDRCWFVPVEEIQGASAGDSCTNVWLADATPSINRALGEIEQQLPPDLFFRANRRELINVRFVERVDPWFSHSIRVTLRNGRIVELSRRQARVFRERFGV